MEIFLDAFVEEKSTEWDKYTTSDERSEWLKSIVTMLMDIVRRIKRSRTPNMDDDTCSQIGD
ncbi:hypothetical protein A4G99_16490 [Haladaptatus sp. R4]|nr:hypothetical protein A4G99_16490 [Haladaptatus sp. R4]